MSAPLFLMVLAVHGFLLHPSGMQMASAQDEQPSQGLSEDTKEIERLNVYSDLADKKLAEMLVTSALSNDPSVREILREAVTREDKEFWIERIGVLSDLVDLKIKQKQIQGIVDDRVQYDLVCVLRYLQGKPHPLTVSFPATPKPLEMESTKLQQIDVQTEYADFQRLPFAVVPYQIEPSISLVNESGETVECPNPGWVNTGGIVSTTLIAHGERQDNQYDLGKRFGPLLPGRYTVSATLNYSLFEDGAELTPGFLPSCTQELLVKPCHLKITEAELKKVETHLAGLGDDKVPLVVGRLDNGGSLLDPQSDHYQLIASMRHKCLPVLLKSLKDETQSKVAKANLFILLHQITGHLDPQIFNSASCGKIETLGAETHQEFDELIDLIERSFPPQEIDVEAQAEFAERWISFIESMYEFEIVVEEK